ncbi:Protein DETOXIFICATION 21 [Zea mays]|uniref:Protein DETOXIFICATION 21 n=1 Tax=Zea mays TaxID=4577 RepID=A0A1D6EIR4_MAIZE|nr:Protein DETOXIFICATION 21 [Zea mays]
MGRGGDEQGAAAGATGGVGPPAPQRNISRRRGWRRQGGGGVVGAAAAAARVGGEQEAVGGGGAVHLHALLLLRRHRHQPGLHRPHRRHGAGRLRARLHRAHEVQQRHPAGHGERAGDVVRAVVRREAVPHAGHLPAAVVDHPVRVRRGAAPRVPVHGAAAGGAGAGPGYRGGGRDHLALVHPRDVLLRVVLHAADVPAGAEQERGDHVPGHAEPRPPPAPVLAGHRQAPPRPRRRHGLHGCRHVDPRARPARLRLLRRVPAHLDRLLLRRLRRPRRHRQAVAVVWRHALVKLRRVVTYG